MLFAITTVRSAAAFQISRSALNAHHAYMRAHSDKILAAGPTVRGDGTPIGSVCIFEADTLLAAAQFVEDDPMTASGAQHTIEIVEWQMVGFDRVYPHAQPVDSSQ